MEGNRHGGQGVGMASSQSGIKWVSWLKSPCLDNSQLLGVLKKKKKKRQSIMNRWKFFICLSLSGFVPNNINCLYNYCIMLSIIVLLH